MRWRWWRREPDGAQARAAQAEAEAQLAQARAQLAQAQARERRVRAVEQVARAQRVTADELARAVELAMRLRGST